ncbi:hypothetical protein LVJ85_02245 [Neisseria sp. Dent CA1/247]|uniref:hypothetical protein n=1 Tax=Neisseria sp. Dent CA1/247 TaxID=2912675 RepID=UPI001FD2428A|nr:hypothetical protein [Neisseria sp. Dent CA1/247]UOO77342.1 hypothetical protein LVJ85_02245 [Neisseria sp. Dent CA1/247]
MAKIILEIEDTPDGRVEIVGKSSRPLPQDYRDMTGAETIAGRLLVFMREELDCYPPRLN